MCTWVFSGLILGARKVNDCGPFRSPKNFVADSTELTKCFVIPCYLLRRLPFLSAGARKYT